MKIEYMRGALGAALWALMALPAFGQHEGQQMPGAGPPASPASLSSCAQNSQGVTRSIDALSRRIDEARQTNDAPTMRAAVADLEVALAQMKSQLADCTALTQGGVTGNMGGMDHSKMQMAPTSAAASGSGASSSGAKTAAPMAGMDHSKTPGTPPATTSRTEPSKMAGMDHSTMTEDKGAPAAAVTSSKAAQAAAVVFTLRTQPAPPRSGKNDFEVTVKDADGKPIGDAEVSLAFYVAPMPSMNMPEMRNTVKLTAAGNGIYKGSGTIGMAADWDVTVTASRNGQQLGVKKMKLTAK